MAVGMVEARFRVFFPPATGSCDIAAKGGGRGLGLLGPRIRRSVAYTQSSPRARHRWHVGCSPEHFEPIDPFMRKYQKGGGKKGHTFALRARHFSHA